MHYVSPGHCPARQILRSVALAALLALLLGLLAAAESSAGADENRESATAARGLDPVKVTTTLTNTTFMPVVIGNFPPTPSAFGVQVYGSLSDASTGLLDMADAGTYWVRSQIAWSTVEPTKTSTDSFLYGSYDPSFLAVSRRGMQLVVTIDSNPSWASTYTNGPIDKTDLSDFVDFVRTTVERYDGDGIDDAPGSPVVKYWEFYNEPDAADPVRAEWGSSYWGANAQKYAQMLCAVRPALKAANPDAQIVLGGMAYDWFNDGANPGPFERDFLDDVLKYGASCLDVMNFHYYPPFASNWAAYGSGLSGKANYLRSKLRSYGVGDMPMIVTEAGWHSNAVKGSESTPEIQSRYVIKLFTQAMASNVRGMMWWTWSDLYGYLPENGLVTVDLAHKPSYMAYRTLTTKLKAGYFQRALSSSELGTSSAEGYLFKGGNGYNTYVLWSNDSASHTIALAGHQANVFDMYGSLIKQVNDSDDGQANSYVPVTAEANPIYVEVVK